VKGSVVRAFACALLLLAAPCAEAAPRRVVSLDYCADQYVLALADRGQIAAVSRGAARDDSFYRARAAGLARTRGTLEEVLALAPDLVVRNWGGPWDAQTVYARFGVPVLQVGDPADFAAARADLLNAAQKLGQPARGAALAADLDARLARLAALPAPRAPDVLYLSAGGAVAGEGVMIDSVIRAAGGRNFTRGAGWTVLPLERLARLPPVLIATGFFGTGRERMNAWSPSRHPVLRRALAQSRAVELPAAAISCQAWHAIDAAETLGAALRRAP
jgi:iron complex transport system substrate-binding protein